MLGDDFYKRFMATEKAVSFGATKGVAPPMSVFPMPSNREELYFVCSSPQILVGRVEDLRGAYYVTETSVFELQQWLAPIMRVECRMIEPPRWQVNEREPFRNERGGEGPFLARNMTVAMEFEFTLSWEETTETFTIAEVGDNQGADQQKGAVTDAWKRGFRRGLGFGLPLLLSKDAKDPVRYCWDRSAKLYSEIERKIWE